MLTIRARIDPSETSEFVQQSLRDVRSYIEEHGLTIDGPPFSVCHSSSATEVDVEVGWPLARHGPGTRRIHAGELPTNLIGHAGGGTSR